MSRMLADFGKRFGEAVDGVATLPKNRMKTPDRTTKVVSKTAIVPLKAADPSMIDCRRWWLRLDVGGSCIHALFDSGTARTAIGPIGLRIASACGRTITPYEGPGAKLANGQRAVVHGLVELPFKLQQQCRYLQVMVMSTLNIDCIVGTDFMRAFNAVLLPRENRLEIEGTAESVPLELSTFPERRTTTLAAIGPVVFVAKDLLTTNTGRDVEQPTRVLRLRQN